MAVVTATQNPPSVGNVLGDEQTTSQVERNADEPLVEGNQGWANVFAKVLTQNPKVKKKTKKTPVLAKAKKDTDVQQQRRGQTKKLKGQIVSEEAHQPRREPLKIVDKEGNVVDEEELSTSNEAEGSQEDDESSTDGEGAPESKKDGTLERLRLRRQRMEVGLVIPQPGDPYEKNLLRTATRGVVQLFNAVSKFQEEKRKKREDHSSDDDEPRYKKGRFMETLSKIQEKKRKDESTATASKWKALRDDFMINSKMRDWDKKESDEDDPK
ncbi:RRP15 protein-like [Tropilaelaps mercedesae]|uniref:RRP15-like protein n=1 Tax=Tropilaelaps mercedesae TaxID=418985 RepID=A0A1V9XAI2_9ACAR|nr:RRP15 protein-like [Tropilaelaps mercedesae]